MTKKSTHSNVITCCYWRKPEKNITQLLYILIYKLLSLSGGLLSICNLPSSTMQIFAYPVFLLLGLGWVGMYTLCLAWAWLDSQGCVVACPEVAKDWEELTCRRSERAATTSTLGHTYFHNLLVSDVFQDIWVAAIFLKIFQYLSGQMSPLAPISFHK